MNFDRSNSQLVDALNVIPIGSQTFSKSYYSLPQGVSPLFLQSGCGSQVTDIDGNTYTDFVNSLLAISLGYCDPDVDAAVTKQLANGVSFSLPHPMETELAQLLVKHIPCAEKVRFGKNGTDATSAAIRLARAFTGREHIAVCGYHGWQDWYIGSTTRNLGVPAAVSALTHPFSFNQFEQVKQIFDEVNGELAAIILEPMNIAYPEPGFLEQLRAFCDENNIVLIFDETITGFRFDLGGAQRLFGVTPDLATFGKGMANGFPISAIVGKDSIMDKMEDIFFSGTFGGETLSIAAAIATIKKMEQQNAPEKIAELGSFLIDQVSQLITELELEQYIAISGHPSWSFLHFHNGTNYDATQLKSLFIQKMVENGFLIMGSHNLSLSHSKEDIERLISCYRKVLPELKSVDETMMFEQAFKGELIKAVFKVR